LARADALTDVAPVSEIVVGGECLRTAVLPINEPGRALARNHPVAVADGATYCAQRMPDGKLRLERAFTPRASTEFSYGADGKVDGVQVRTTDRWTFAARQEAGGRNIIVHNPLDNAMAFRYAQDDVLQEISLNNRLLARCSYGQSADGRMTTVEHYQRRLGLPAIGAIGVAPQAEDAVAMIERFQEDAQHRLSSYTVTQDGEEQSVSFSYPDDSSLRITGLLIGEVVLKTEENALAITGPSGRTTLRFRDGKLSRLETDAGDYVEWNIADGKDTVAEQAVVTAVKGGKTARLTAAKDAYRLTDLRGGTTEYSFSGDRLSCVRGPEGATTQYSYDEAGRLTRVCQPNGTALRYEWADLPRGSRFPGGKALTVCLTESAD
jgi:YD repeat-containing protein